MSNHDDDSKSDPMDPNLVRKSVHTAADQIVLQNREDSSLKTVCGNFNKKILL